MSTEGTCADISDETLLKNRGANTGAAWRQMVGPRCGRAIQVHPRKEGIAACLVITHMSIRPYQTGFCTPIYGISQPKKAGKSGLREDVGNHQNPSLD